MQPTRAGWTLIELLVVVAIIGLLVGLLLPAVQSSREAARRATCQNRMRQVALGVLSFESANQRLPAIYNGTFLARPRSILDEFHFHSWRTAILPQLEQSAAFASLNQSLAATTPANQTAVNAGIGVFVCPSTSNYNPTVPGVAVWNDGQIPVKYDQTAARSDYELIAGVRIPSPVASPVLSDVRFGPWGEPTYGAGGSVLRDRRARLADITDGLSNTLLAGERAGRPDQYARGRPPQRFDPPNWRGMDHHQAAWALSTHLPWIIYNNNTPVNETNATGLYSFHPGGAHAAMADGSVRFARDSTSPAVLGAWITRAGGEVAQGD
ncbi:hypothetical protein OJF2_71980 [Aquisphaera giovannonii]|uniref:DUF1559 domain-containing protein n=1 Tax=Aquisphaera giovannonii TaxID=406548 RepID=A0A5B9WEF7_9BACT|nr:DUF1559 domain-containing protein [Aquisphaera giovannonii]QEH38594.1 hypothetical protein OJF2_71980 [Aquisphaera giovannonii]